jgi:hypothetical protein
MGKKVAEVMHEGRYRRSSQETEDHSTEEINEKPKRLQFPA